MASKKLLLMWLHVIMEVWFVRECLVYSMWLSMSEDSHD